MQFGNVIERQVGLLTFAGGILVALSAWGSGDRNLGSWPQFHGANRDNISSETGLLKQWPEGGPSLLWTYGECGGGFSGVSVAEGMIFTAGDFDAQEKIIALSGSGELLWKTPNGGTWTGPYPGARTTPTYSDGLVYQMNPMGRIAALRAKTGEEVWNVDLQAAFGAKAGTWALAENLTIEGDRLFCLPGGDKALVAALDKHTGATIWTNTDLKETAAYCSPLLVTYKGVRLLIALTQKSVIGVDVATGKLRWSHPHPNRNDQNVTTPIYRDGYVFVSSGHSAGGRLLQINDAVDGVKELWWNETIDNCHGGVILLDDRLYGSACQSGGKGFFCVDLLNGSVRYRDKKTGKLSLTYADGRLYGLSQRGEMFLIAPGKDQMEIVSHFQATHERDDLAFAHPVVCGGRLYVRHAGRLYVYGIGN